MIRPLRGVVTLPYKVDATEGALADALQELEVRLTDPLGRVRLETWRVPSKSQFKNSKRLWKPLKTKMFHVKSIKFS